MFPNTSYALKVGAVERRLISDNGFLLETALSHSLNLDLGIGISFPALSGTLYLALDEISTRYTH